MDNGGTGTISNFPTGVWVDPKGVLRPLMKEARSGDLAALRGNSQQRAGQDDVRRSSPLRMISLTRLGEADPAQRRPWVRAWMRR